VSSFRATFESLSAIDPVLEPSGTQIEEVQSTTKTQRVAVHTHIKVHTRTSPRWPRFCVTVLIAEPFPLRTAGSGAG
jgi:hypothetical protein